MNSIADSPSVAHLTSVHSRYDTRIFLKECRSLVAAGYRVTLAVADGAGNESREGVRILDVGKSSDRMRRMTQATRRLLALARELNADLYHIHDPELLLAGLALKRAGRRVIFDAHEDLPAQILGKPYLLRALRPLVSKGAAVMERFVCRWMDGIVAATPYIRDKFRAMGLHTIDINNFPIVGELQSESDWSAKRNEVCYVGGIAVNRGIFEVVRALELTGSCARLNLAGRLKGLAIEPALRAETGWRQVNERGFVGRGEMRDILARSVAGIVTFLSEPNHTFAQPNKMFEYMSAGIPVIASDFPLWREIVTGADCGLLVDPLDPGAIATAIDTLVKDRALAQSLGENGRKAVLERYNWAEEEKKLLDFYGGFGLVPLASAAAPPILNRTYHS